jgi:hypothetical protein
MKRFVSIWFALLLPLLGALACQMPSSSQPPVVITVVVQPTARPAEATSTTVPAPSSTASLPITGAEVTATPAPPTATAGPACTVLKTANFRKGPGTAYNPPLRGLEAGTTLIPQGFNPKGFPSGSWVQALDPAANQIGWINLDPALITCNIDLTTLPPVAVAPPPPPPAPVVSNSQVDGTPNGLQGKVHFSPTYLMRMEVYDPNGSKDGDGIKRVTFTISDDNGTVYQRTEGTAAYCVFGGGEPNCNAWTQANGQYLWKDGGQPVKNGTYNVVIEVEPKSANGDDSQFGKWFFSITIKLP